MNQYHYSHSTGQSPLHHQRNGRLYQHLLESNYLSDHIYQTGKSNQDNAVHIKFSGSPVKLQNDMDSTQDRQDNSFKSGNACISKKIPDMIGKANLQNHQNHHSNQSQQPSPSFFSNYSIIEMENESCSTLNLYSMSHNPLDQDASVASHNLATKLSNNEGKILCNGLEQQNYNDNNFILENYSSMSSAKRQQISVIQVGGKFQENDFFTNIRESSTHRPSEEMIEQNDKVYQTFVKKQLKSDSHKSKQMHRNKNDGNGTSRTNPNKISVVSNKGNQKLKSQAFSFSAHDKFSKKEDSSKIIIELNRKMDGSNLKQDEQKGAEQIQSPIRRLRFLGTSHLIPKQIKESQPTSHLFHLLQRQQYQREAPKSESKTQRPSVEKQTRSNSIEYKYKPSFMQRRQSIKRENEENLDQSRVMKIFKNQTSAPVQKEQSQGSIIYEKSVVNLCCGMNQEEHVHVNKIGFKSPSKRESKKQNNIQSHNSPFSSEPIVSVDLTNTPSYLKSKPPNYKITSFNSIKNKSDSIESQKDTKKGIKLMGFNPFFPYKKHQE